MKHPEYDKLIALANGEQMQRKYPPTSTSWINITPARALRLLGGGVEIRIKPRTMTINGIEFPEPMREAPENDAQYWVVDIINKRLAFRATWRGTTPDLQWLKAGLCQATEQGAIDCAKALLSLLAPQEEKT